MKVQRNYAPQDHLRRLTRADDNLPFELVTLSDAELPHRRDGPLVHIYENSLVHGATKNGLDLLSPASFWPL